MTGKRRLWQGGMSDEAAEAIEKRFRAVERQAEKRLRAAREGGFDVAQVEQVNEADRKAAFDEVLTARISPLQGLLRGLDASEAQAGATAERDGSHSPANPSTFPLEPETDDDR